MARACDSLQRVVVLLAVLFVPFHCSQQHNASQEQTLLEIQHLLYYPVVLSSWNNATDFCNSVQSSSVTVVCYEDVVTQLHIINSDKQPPLPKDFSIDTFFATLVRLPSLKVLKLVSLGLWGRLPSTISQLSSLEILNITSNHFTGPIQPEIASLTNLQSLVLDDNMFTGWVPARIGLLSRLSVLSLQNNLLNGPLPESLGSLVDLRVLGLSHNNLSGQVPDLHSLTNLQVLELEDNSLGPEFPRVTNRTISIVLRDNKFTAGLPEELHSFYQLKRLDIALNRFMGPFPTSILSLPSLTYLDIEGNRFTGKLFEDLACNPELEFVDLSANLLTGKLPSCLVSSKARNAVYDGNCLTTSIGDEVKSQKPVSFCSNEALAVGIIPRHHKDGKGSKVAFGIVGGIIGGLLLVGVAFLIFRQVHGKKTVKPPPPMPENGSVSSYSSKLLSDARYVSQAMKLGTVGVPPHRAFSLEELEEATNGFDTSTFMGEGSNGQMYRGRLKDGSYVAIQCLKMKRNHSTQTFTRHMELISKLRHQHLVSVLGHCFEFCLDDSSVSRLFLVFEYAPNGTLRDWISGNNDGRTLSWSQRIAAAISIVKGVQFLHSGIVPRMFSSNLKITDILLDQNFAAKISCYHLPLLDQNIQKMQQDGAQSYFNIFKEPNRARVSNPEKVDVYDFGVILLEIIIGKPLCTQKEVESIKQQFYTRIAADDAVLKDVVDPAVRDTCSDQSVTTMVEICSRCLANDPSERPSVEDMLWNLQFAAQVQDAWHSSEGSPVSSSQHAITQQ